MPTKTYVSISGNRLLHTLKPAREISSGTDIRDFEWNVITLLELLFRGNELLLIFFISRGNGIIIRWNELKISGKETII